jgi:hypothetical protein
MERAMLCKLALPGRQNNVHLFDYWLMQKTFDQAKSMTLHAGDSG